MNRKQRRKAAKLLTKKNISKEEKELVSKVKALDKSKVEFLKYYLGLFFNYHIIGSLKSFWGSFIDLAQSLISVGYCVTLLLLNFLRLALTLVATPLAIIPFLIIKKRKIRKTLEDCNGS